MTGPLNANEAVLQIENAESKVGCFLATSRTGRTEKRFYTEKSLEGFFYDLGWHFLDVASFRELCNVTEAPKRLFGCIRIKR